MKTLCLVLLILCASSAAADDLRTRELLRDVEPNGYGLGVNRDEFSRPHVYRDNDGEKVPGIFNEGVERDAYGLGVHKDQFGRPVYDSRP